MSQDAQQDVPAAQLLLEETRGAEALEWVREQNARTEGLLHGPEYEALRGEILQVLDAPDRLAAVAKRGDRYLNFWRDAEHPRGLWRSTDWESYRAGDPEWRILLDVDALAAAEGIDWLFAGAVHLRPDADRAMVKLSPDGGDAGQWREFDLETGDWVPGGFTLPTAKSSVSWVHRDELLVMTVLDEDDATASTYPIRVRRLARGAEIAEAPEVFAVERDHLTAAAGFDPTPGWERFVEVDVIDFHRSRTRVRGLDEPSAREVEVPDHVEVGLHREWITLSPQLDWEHEGTPIAPGTLLVGRLEEFLSTGGGLRPVFVPDDHTSLSGITWTRDWLVLSLLRDVATSIELADPRHDFRRHPIDLGLPLQDISVGPVDAEAGDELWITTTGFLTPTTLLRGEIADADPDAEGPQITTREIARAPERFDASQHTVSQHFAISADGTRVPYFLVAPADAPADGATPTLMTGYGGFQLARLPGYLGTVGRGWLDHDHGGGRRGAYVLANIRGGGEYGPAWHRAALREKRPRAYEDFIAVAEDLARRGVADAGHLVAHGGSNGGLLIGNMLTRRPELFAGLSCGVPLLDMLRYTLLSAGTSWIAEYGDPDVEGDREHLREISPLHRLEADAEYPPILIWTATSDDRVGPAQARVMAARMRELGHERTHFHEELDGGHAGAGDNAQAAALQARWMLYLRRAIAGELP